MTIGIIYSVIAPLVLILVLIAFGLFWMAFRYNIIFVTKSVSDTGGLLYPTALNQLFVGIYTFEICLIGLFLLARNQDRKWTCLGQAVIMVVATVLTGGFQMILSQAFEPLLRFLPRIIRNASSEPGITNEGVSPVCENNALHACRATIWIPRDPLGISDSEILETRESNDDLWIRNDKARINMDRRIEIDEG